MSFSTVQELRTLTLVGGAFTEIALREGLRHVYRGSFPVATLTMGQLSVLGEVELGDGFPSGAEVLLRLEPDMLAHLVKVGGGCELAVAGTSREAVDAVAADLIAALRDPEPDDGQVPISFWSQSVGHPLSARRRIASPTWQEIRSNYSAVTRTALDELMAVTEPGPGGLVLWHGEPGTGKSFALRALAREWRGWCEAHFITDAEVFLGGKTSYLLNVLSRSDAEPGADARWRLIVLEDAGELLAADARAVMGQALSRLLNLTDGLLGAGLRAVVLLTTNEPLRRLHPAVIRPGRTWAEIEFTALAAQEAGAWLEARGAGGRVTGESTLAELYALLGGRAIPGRAGVGFAA